MMNREREWTQEEQEAYSQERERQQVRFSMPETFLRNIAVEIENGEGKINPEKVRDMLAEFNKETVLPQGFSQIDIGEIRERAESYANYDLEVPLAGGNIKNIEAIVELLPKQDLGE